MSDPKNFPLNIPSKMTAAQREAVKAYDERHAACKSPFERIALDNEWVDGIPLGLLAMADKMDRRIPKTCREAAARFRAWADRTPYETERHRNDARAEILEAFGDAPVPAAILAEFDFEKN